MNNRHLAVCLLGLASCQTYEARPLDLEAYKQSLEERKLDASALDPLRDRLDACSLAGEPFDASDGIDWREGQAVALLYNPSLRIARVSLEGTEAAALEAGAWKDPWFSLNLLRITESVASPWVIIPGLAFNLPLSGRRAVARDVATARVEAADQAVLEAEWETLLAVRTAWIHWTRVRLDVEERERFLQDLGSLVESAQRLESAGELRPSDASVIALVGARMQSDLDRVRGEQGVLEQELRAVLGLTPDAPFAFVPSLTATPTQASRNDAQPQTIDGHPSLARLRAAYDVAEEELRLQIERQGPDLQLGPLVERDGGQDRVGFQSTLPLPLWNKNRLGIAKAHGTRDLARAKFEAAYQGLVGRLARAKAQAQTVRRQREDFERQLVPLAGEHWLEAKRLLSLGEVDLLTALESLERAQATRLDWIRVRAEEAELDAELEHLWGPSSAGPSKAAQDMDEDSQ